MNRLPSDEQNAPISFPKATSGFVAGTPILTPEGSKPIEQLQPGDVIVTQPDDSQGDHEPEDHEDDHTGENARWWEWN